MISIEITQELKRRLAWILTSYGGLNNFISYLKESLYIEANIEYTALPSYQKLNLFNRLKLLLQFESNIILLSPWDLFVDLRQQNSITENINSYIDINEPYKLYNIDGNLLYTVKRHLGIFGESKLDKNLILNSVNTSMYFLKYTLHNGQEQIKLILINIHSKTSTTSNINFTPIKERLISSLSIINNSNTSLNIYKTDSTYIENPTINFLTSPSNLHTILANDSKTFNVADPCYFFTQTNVNIVQTKITYTDSNIVFIPNNNLVFVGSNTSINLLNRVFNRLIKYTNKPIEDILTYTKI